MVHALASFFEFTKRVRSTEPVSRAQNEEKSNDDMGSNIMGLRIVLHWESGHRARLPDAGGMRDGGGSRPYQQGRVCNVGLVHSRADNNCPAGDGTVGTNGNGCRAPYDKLRVLSGEVSERVWYMRSPPFKLLKRFEILKGGAGRDAPTGRKPGKLARTPSPSSLMVGRLFPGCPSCNFCRTSCQRRRIGSNNRWRPL